MSSTPAPAALVSREELWTEAGRHESAGRWQDAARTLGLLSERYLDQGRTNLYVVERLAADLGRAGRPASALAFLTSLRTRLRLAGDTFGEFAFGMRMAALALDAGDVASARRFVETLPGEMLRSPWLEDTDRSIGHANRLRWVGHGQADHDLLCGQLLVLLARLSEAEGRYEPALRMARAALDRTRDLNALFYRDELVIFVAELALDMGDPRLADGLLPEAPDGLDGLARIKRAVLRTRAALLAGRLSHAHHLALALGELARVTERADLVLQAVWAAAQGLVILNRTLDAQQLIDRFEGQVLGDGAPASALIQRWTGPFDDLRALIRRRREGIAQDWTSPDLPAVWDAEQDEEPNSVDGPRTFAPVTTPERPVARFAQRWTRAANAVLSALVDGDGTNARSRLTALEVLTGACDSPRMRARARYFAGLVALAGGAHEEARSALTEAADALCAIGLRLDEWRCRSALAFVIKALGDRVAHARETVIGKVLLDQLTGGLDSEDAPFFRGNKSSVVDDYVVSRAEAIREEANRVGRWDAWPWWRRHRQTKLVRPFAAELGLLNGWHLRRELATSSTRRAPPVEEVDPESATGEAQVEIWVERQLALMRARVPGTWVGGARWWSARIPRDTCVVRFYCAVDRLYVLTVCRGDARLHRVSVSRVGLRDGIRLAVMTVLDEARTGVRAAAESALRKLAALLGLEQWAGSLPQIRRLCVVPHDSIVQVPLAALPLAGKAICNRFAISWALQERLRRSKGRRPLRRSRFMGVAVREYTDPRLPPLDDVSAEVRSAALAVAGRATDLLEDGAARREQVMAALSRATWAHFACHGEFEPSRPQDSKLHLAGGDTLTIADIQGLSLCRLRGAVLAACSLASARVLPGNELISMPAAFLAAGAGGVIAPLWPLEHEAAQRLVARFYGACRTLAPVDALRLVQQQGAAAAEPPFTWAAIQVYGEP